MTNGSAARAPSNGGGSFSGARHHPGMFDRFADRIATVTARAWFFAACVALVAVWLRSSCDRPWGSKMT
jgi:hypothetical protein